MTEEKKGGPSLAEACREGPAAFLSQRQLGVVIPYATCVYGKRDLHFTYTMRITDVLRGRSWHCVHRYSEFRHLHQQVGKRYVMGWEAPFPGLLLTKKSNRTTIEIEKRRHLLENYMKELFHEMLRAGNGTLGQRRGAASRRGAHAATTVVADFTQLLSFICYPWPVAGLHCVDDVEASLRTLRAPAPNVDALSFCSERAEMLLAHSSQSDLAPLGDGESTSTFTQSTASSGPPTPSVFVVPAAAVTTHWGAPSVLPGPGLAVSLPTATLQQTLSGAWEMLVHAQRTDERARLRYLYDQAAALSSAIRASESDVLMDAREVQQFLVEFERIHPFSAYKTLADELESISTTFSPESMARAAERTMGVYKHGASSARMDTGCSGRQAADDVARTKWSPGLSPHSPLDGSLTATDSHDTPLTASASQDTSRSPSSAPAGWYHSDGSISESAVKRRGSGKSAELSTSLLLSKEAVANQAIDSPRSMHCRRTPSLASLRSEREQAIFASSKGIFSMDTNRLCGRRDTHCCHYTLDVEEEQLAFACLKTGLFPDSHEREPENASGNALSFLSTFVENEARVQHRKANGRHRSLTDRYVEAVCAAPVEGCFCTDRNFCASDEGGDVYVTTGGYVIAICPPTECCEMP